MNDDEAAIQRALSSYSLHASLADWDTVVSLFQPDGVWEIPHMDLRFAGHEAIRAALTALTAHMDPIFQMNAPGLIDVTGDSATARSGIRESGKLAGKDESFDFFGVYVDRLARTADGWKFAHRSFQAKATHRHQLLPLEG